MNLLKTLSLTLIILLISSIAQADLKQKIYDKVVDGTERVGEKLHSTLALAKELGFYVDEVRFEVSITPKVEVYFRDKGDTGQLSQLLRQANKVEKGVLRLLQATRRFKLNNYSPTGVKLITGIAKPSVEILTTWEE